MNINIFNLKCTFLVFFIRFLCIFYILISVQNIFFQKKLFAQTPTKNVQFDYNYLPTTENLPINAWAGGLNSPQIYAMDINQDLEDDLVIFDKHNAKFYTFTANVYSKKYSYRPEFEQYFPNCKNWVVIIDYDKDGKKDIFTDGDNGVRVFRNVGIQTPDFQLITENIITKTNNGEGNIIVPATDVPAIVDIDDDGDLDIFTFDFAQGNWIEFYENVSPKSPPVPKGGANIKERINTKKKEYIVENLIFVKKNPCWGGILEKVNCGEFEFNKACAGGGGANENTEKNKKNAFHAGSTLQLVDLNGDKKLDVLIGDISCNELYFFKNNGTNLRPKFMQFDRNFPKQNPIRLLFPAVYFVDVTFDKVPDMLVVPNVWLQDGEVNHWDKSIYVYENKNTPKKPDWHLTTTNFLQNDMLDFGENVSAFAFDVDNDKDLDLLISAKKTNGNIDNNLLENKGTNKNPIFTQNKGFQEKYLVDSLKNKIFQNHFIYKSNYLQNYISYLEKPLEKSNENSGQNPRQNPNDFNLFYKNIKLDEFHKFPFSLQKNDSPALMDIDEDGDVDVCVAKGNGSMIWYENIRIKNKNTKKTDFTADTFEKEKPFFIQNPNPANTELRLATHDINADGQVDLLITDANGQIKIYLDIAKKFKEKTENENLQINKLETEKQTETQETYFFEADYNAKKQENIYIGHGIMPQIVDIDGDDMPELLLGMRTGGLKFAKNTTEKPKIIAKYYKKDQMLVLNVPFSGQLRGENTQGELLFDLSVAEFREIYPVKLTEKQIQGLKISHRNSRYKTIWLKNLEIMD